MEPTTVLKVISSVASTVILAFFIHQYILLVLRPKRHRSHLQNQGISGPPPSLLLGNIPDINKAIRATNSPPPPPSSSKLDHSWFSKLFPYFDLWRRTYGPVFVYSTGKIQQLCISDVELVKEMSLWTSLSLGKPSYLSQDLRPLLGQGILSSSGIIWSHQRKIIAPEFYLDKVKCMLNLMIETTLSTVKSWETRIVSEGGAADIWIDDDLRSLSADIISKACFGSSYIKGEHIFAHIRTLQKSLTKQQVGIPGLRYLPTKNNREIWRLEREIDSMILEVVNQRTQKGSEDKDFLQMIVEAAESNGMSWKLMSRDKFITDNCKNIYFAGHETTAITASWCLMLLAAYPDWQNRVRAEVIQHGFPSPDSIRSFKTLNMVIQETLRLYPPAAFAVRQAMEDVRFKDIVIPKGMNIRVLIPVLQQNEDIWGPDALEFNPERFKNGILGACKSPQAYMPFGIGGRTCLGQHFAMLELKVIISIILSKFKFLLSPTFNHFPVHRMVVEPGKGVCLHMKPRPA